jgi:hypothetical protein
LVEKLVDQSVSKMVARKVEKTAERKVVLLAALKDHESAGQ